MGSVHGRVERALRVWNQWALLSIEELQQQFKMDTAYVGKMNMGALLPIGLGIWGIVDQFARHRKTFVMLFVMHAATL